MPRRVSFDDPPALHQIAAHHAILEEAIFLYYSPDNPRCGELFVFATANEVRTKPDATLHEARAASAMTLLASIEASFRVDYLQRNYAKKRDDLSRAFPCATPALGDREIENAAERVGRAIARRMEL